MTSVSIKDDPALLDRLVGDQRAASGLFAAGAYWSEYTERIVEEIRLSGIGEFRRNTRIGKGFTDTLQRSPMDTRLRKSRTFRFHQLVAALPLVRRHVLSHYERLIRNVQTEAIQHEGALLQLKGRAMMEKHAALLRTLDTVAGGSDHAMEIDGRPIALAYLRQLGRLEALAPTMAFEDGARVLEIGGGFGVNAHLQLTLFPQIRHYLYVDIPPMLYIGTQYLKAHFGDAVLSYTDWCRDKPGDLAALPQRIYCLPPWVLTDLVFPWDRAMNAASFQEMDGAQIDFYLDYLSRNARPDARLAALYYCSNNRSLEEADFMATLSAHMQVEALGQPEGNLDPQMLYFLARPGKG